VLLRDRGLTQWRKREAGVTLLVPPQALRPAFERLSQEAAQWEISRLLRGTTLESAAAALHRAYRLRRPHRCGGGGQSGARRIDTSIR